MNDALTPEVIENFGDLPNHIQVRFLDAVDQIKEKTRSV